MAIIVINPYQYAAPIGPSADPYSDYVSLLLHGNGTNNSTTVTDSSGYNHAVTPVADAKISTTQNKFGGASIYLLSDLSSGVTGEVHYVDSGYNIISTPRPDMLQDKTIYENQD